MPECAYTNRILNMPRVLNRQSFEYGSSLIVLVLHKVLNLPECSKYDRILNMAGFWICKSYTGF